MFFAYFLKSLNSNFRYIGYTADINKRLNDHNQGLNQSTKHYRPLEIDAYIAVKSKQKAVELEKYFKTGSGIAFSRKRIITYEASAK